MRQGLPRLIHSLCRQQNTACVDSAKQVEPSHARLGFPAHPRRLVCRSGVSREADGPTDCRQRHDSSSPSFAAYAAPTGSREGPCRAWLGTTVLIHSSWTKYHHVLQRPMRQGLPRLIHSLCRQQNTACVDSAKQVEPSHARLGFPAHPRRLVCRSGVSREADGPTDCRQRHDSSSPSFAAYAAPTGGRGGPCGAWLGTTYWRRTACTTCSRRSRRITSARWLRSRTWMLKHSTAALKSRSR